MRTTLPTGRSGSSAAQMLLPGETPHRYQAHRLVDEYRRVRYDSMKPVVIPAATESTRPPAGRRHGAISSSAEAISCGFTASTRVRATFAVGPAPPRRLRGRRPAGRCLLGWQGTHPGAPWYRLADAELAECCRRVNSGRPAAWAGRRVRPGSSWLRWMSAAPALSARYFGVLVPGMGITY